MKILSLVATIIFISIFGSFFLPLILVMFIIFFLSTAMGKSHD
jgi:hypothetical protein